MGINSAMYNGVSGLSSFSTAISVVSDNVANANTTAFKTNSVHFGDMVNSYYSMNSNDTESEGSGSMVLGISTDYAQGLMQNTSYWSDLCISGDGFFQVKDPVSGKLYYTRDGCFRLDKDNYLVTQQGLRVQSTEGADIQIPDADPPYVSYRVDSDGQLFATDTAGDETGPPDLPRILLSTFSNKDGLARQGNNLYLDGPAVGQVFTNVDDPEMLGKIVDYSLESSNVDLAAQMVDMIIFQASYNANSKTITTCKDMIDTTINMV